MQKDTQGLQGLIEALDNLFNFLIISLNNSHIHPIWLLNLIQMLFNNIDSPLDILIFVIDFSLINFSEGVLSLCRYGMAYILSLLS